MERPQIHLKQLIRKTIILYCAWSAIYFAISGVSSRAEIKEWIECIVTLRGRAPIWYLSALALAEIVFLVVLYVADKWRFSRNRVVCISLLVSACASVISIEVMGTPDSNITVITYLETTALRLLPTYFFFASGYVLTDYFEKIRPMTNAIVFAVVSVSYVVGYHNIDNLVNVHTAMFGNGIVFFLFATLGSVSLITFCRLIENICRFRFLTYVGKCTLSIMALHYYPFNTLPFSVKVASYLVPNHSIMIFLLSTFIIITICCFFRELVKKVNIVG